MESIILIIIGIVFGVANVIPGVSGGTMLVVFGKYDQIIKAVSNIKKDFKNSVLFLLPLLIGAAAGILGFAHLITFLFNNVPVATNSFFLGLIIGGIPLIYRKAMEGGFKLSCILPFVITLGIMIWMFLMPQGDTTAITSLTVKDFIVLLIASAFAAICMIIPGVSGSFVLVLLGYYQTVITAITDFNILVMIPIGLGVLIGIIGGAKIINAVIYRFPQQTYFAILGLVVGSLFTFYDEIVPNFSLNAEGFASVFVLLIGTAIALFFGSQKLQNILNKKKKD